MQREKEPTLPSEDVHIMLPWPTDTLRAVSDRYKSLSDRLFVMANMAGELKLRVESDEVKVETKWTGLVNPPLGNIPPQTPKQPILLFPNYFLGGSPIRALPALLRRS